jgi:hypothetical protein
MGGSTVVRYEGHPDKASLPRAWVSNDVAQRLRELAWENDHTMVEEIRIAVRAHLKRNGREVGRKTEAAPGQGGSVTTARDTSARHVCSA